jgi:hypothetical protein
MKLIELKEREKKKKISGRNIVLQVIFLFKIK